MPNKARNGEGAGVDCVEMGVSEADCRPLYASAKPATAATAPEAAKPAPLRCAIPTAVIFAVLAAIAGVGVSYLALRGGGGDAVVRVHVSSGQLRTVLEFPRRRGTLTAADLLKEVAAELGVHRDFLVLVRRGGPAVAGGRVQQRAFNSRRVGAPAGEDASAEADQRSLESWGIPADGDAELDCLLRPLRGDHIHNALAIYITGMLVDPLSDRPLQSTLFEGRSMAAAPGQQHIQQLWPHFGVHGGHPEWGGEGFAHVHPGSAWAWFRESEGLGSTLDLLLEQVGVGVWDPDSLRYPFGPWHLPQGPAGADTRTVVVDFPADLRAGVEFGDCAEIERTGTRPASTGGFPLSQLQNAAPYTARDYSDGRSVISSNASHTWRLYYYSHWLDPEPSQVVELGLGRLWIHENMAMMVLSYEPRVRSGPPPRPPPCQVRLLSNKLLLDGTTSQSVYQIAQHYALGFDSRPYPMPNAPYTPQEALNRNVPPTQSGIPADVPGWVKSLRSLPTDHLL
eukprot:TRINITY_DN47080_c0_g1_i1.p1 TRINITY_DN47080_c0_g1~~TRINITY_DN47080_c0_g1_i1.p1  ORF type:complete len:558 (+),score=142.69 TRINITY_DN47080_c0_g1_i1:146-1675(+)